MNADTNLPEKPDYKVCVQVCTLCMETASRELYEKLCEASSDLPDIKIEPVECMAVCDNPTTIAFRAPGKWSYVIGGVGANGDVEDVIRAAQAVAKSSLGIPKMNERPLFFRNGVICRLPPHEEV
ncbi:MAG: hypothetical protein COB78_02685 [Hyphomicrobiales bacterium]|nr:MAG: hypothetical protein COB78_02685 [Hyphomicrobiales bacterium]